MLCYRCGSHVPDSAESCGTCGQKLSAGGVRQATGTFSRKRLQGAQVENAPYQVGEVVSGRYEIRDVVGAGPVGFVFRALDREVDVEVALKVIHQRLVQTQEERRLFAKQIRVARKLSHQNLIRVYEEGEDQERPYYTMQLLEGLTLRKIIDLRLQRGDFFSFKEIEPILGQIANALDGAHKLGAHSNLKPENVIVLPDLLKVSDYGLAMAIPHLPFVQAARQKKAERYLSPEYVQGGEIDQRADIYALGVIVGEMLSGLTPDGAVPELGRRNHEVPPQMEGLYRRALNTNPLARPKTASEFFDEFSEITRRVSPPPMRRAEPPTPAVTRQRPAMPVSAVAGGPTATVELRRVDKPPPPVPDEEIQSVEVSLNGSSQEYLPPDATQPLDATQIPLPPRGGDVEETQLMPSLNTGDIPLPPEELAEPTQSRQIPRKSRAGMWLFVGFTIAGLSLGAAGGYWLLGRVRQPAQPIARATPAPEQPSPAIAQAPAAVPAAVPEKAPAAPVGPTGATGPARTQPAAGANTAAADAKKAEDARKADEARLADERRRADDRARELAEAEAKRRAEQDRLAEEKRREAERLAQERKAAEEAKKTVVAAAATGPKNDCPDGMKYVGAGSFRMGTARDDPMMGFDEKILSSVTVGAFCVDIYEYPNRRGSMPKTGVSWSDAKRMCEAAGKRLCAEDEWEKACKGPGNARYPYGNTYDADACNTEDAQGEDRPLSSSGRFHKCRSGYGIADMSGNAAEWTGSSYAGGGDKAQKGGSFSKPDYAARCSARKNGSPTARAQDVGFRCCADPK